MNKKKYEPFFHLAKRTEYSSWKAWLLRIGAFVLSILVCAIITTIITKKDMGYFFQKFFSGLFSTKNNVWNLFHNIAILLLIALAVTPCFKMKFWNIGGEGQILVGALGCSVAICFMGGKYSDGVVYLVSIILAIAFSIVWSLLPAIFKAKWNTNETLLTLMMNYIAVCLTEYFIKSVASSGTGTLVFSKGIIEGIGGNEFILKIIVAIVLTIVMGVYLSFSKHGYEITVVGESENTARYIGINTKKVILRTLALCGVISGIIGFLLISATNHSLSSTYTVGGKGFIGVLISWLGHFNPLGMVFATFSVVFIDRGATGVAMYTRLGSSYTSVLTGVFFLFIIAVEFFINYKIVFRSRKVKVKKEATGEVK